tara:strand:+ start:2645 stop:2764 length:120 start_codon:yes stop_codon:yes gene_type:complete
METNKLKQIIDWLIGTLTCIGVLFYCIGASFMLIFINDE